MSGCRRYRSAAVVALVAVATAGCGGQLDKVVVSGDVSYRGEPVDNGEILFYPMGATRGPVSGASIKDGHYQALGKGGVPIGTHRVEIRGFRSAGMNRSQAKAAAKAGMEGGVREQYLPKKYNDDSRLEVTVVGDDSQATHDFKLVE